MASTFIGLQMQVSLRNPPGVKLKGIVSNIVAGDSLTLSNVFLDNGSYLPTIYLNASNIADLSQVQEPPVQLLQTRQVPAPASATVPTATPGPAPVPAPLAFTAPPPETVAAPVYPQPTPSSSFQDPAILSVGKRPGSVSKLSVDHPAQPNIGEKRDPPPIIPTLSQLNNVSTSGDATPTLGPLEGLKELGIRDDVPGILHPPPGTFNTASPSVEPETTDRKKKRRSKYGDRRRNAQTLAAEDSIEGSPAPQRTKPPNRGKGWRQTPMLQDTPSFQPYKSLNRTSKGKGQQNDNGWASEDVTDVQEMGDFDFEGGLAKFDKQNVFDELRKADQTDDAERLVSHNRLPRPKPGTAGGKNLHYSENVLDVQSAIAKPKDNHRDFWNSEADEGFLDGGERLSGREPGSGRSSRRGESKMSTTRRSQSRKASTTGLGVGSARPNSGVSFLNLPRSSSQHSLRRPSGDLTIRTDHTKPQLAGAQTQGFYLANADRRVDTVSALQMLNIENIAQNELGLTEALMTENAGRGIAEVTFTALAEPAIKVRAAEQPSLHNPPTVVILAGNNKSGIRAIAAGRHLRNKGVNILLCVVGLERETELLEDLRQQIQIFRNFGGKVYNKTQLFDQLRKSNSTTGTPILGSSGSSKSATLIIDALLGLAISFEELRTSDQAAVYELIEWANRNEAFVLAIDVPTGIDPSTGKVSIIDGNKLYAKPRYVVAMGAPKKGLLEAMALGDDDDGGPASGPAGEDGWKLFVADLGLGAAVWKRAGAKLRRGIDFGGGSWVLEMRYRGPDDSVEAE